ASADSKSSSRLGGVMGNMDETLRNGGEEAVFARLASVIPLGDNDGDAAPEEPSPAPIVIIIKSGNLQAVVDKSEAALIDAGAPLYARGGELVKPIIEDVAAFRGRRTKVTRLKVVNVDCLRDHLSRTVVYQRYDSRLKKVVLTNPPREVAATLLARDGEWKFPRLSGIITTPTLRPDGSILSEPGYDKRTGRLLVAALD